jgi:hypothetical protein
VVFPALGEVPVDEVFTDSRGRATSMVETALQLGTTVE